LTIEILGATRLKRENDDGGVMEFQFFVSLHPGIYNIAAIITTRPFLSILPMFSKAESASARKYLRLAYFDI
jgi:hypothetical protein